MVFAGSASAEEDDLKGAHTRIYEDGTLVTDRITAGGGLFENVKVIGTLRNPFTIPASSFDIDYSDNIAQQGGFIPISYTVPCNTAQSGRVIRIVNWKWGGDEQVGASAIGLSDQNCAFLEDGIRKKEIYLSRECVTLLGYGDPARFYGWIVLQRTDLMTVKAYGRHMKVLAQGVINCGAKPTFGKYYTFDATTLSAERQSTGTFKVTLPAAWGLSDNGYVVLLTTLGRTSSDNVIVSSVKETRAGYFVFDCESVQANYIDDAKVMFLISNQSDFVNVENEVDKDTIRDEVTGTTAQGNGKLKLTVTPTTAKVRIDGTYVNVNGGTGAVTEDLSYGSHTVEVSASGYKTQTFAVSISEGTVTKTVALSEAELTGISISGMQSISDTAQYTAVYSPSDVLSKYRGVTWSVVSGSAYATIDQNGVVTAKDGASSSVVVIRATSTYNTAIYAEKTISVTYAAGPEISFSDDDNGVIRIGATETRVSCRFQFSNLENLTAAVSGGLVDVDLQLSNDGVSSGEFGFSLAENTSSSERRGVVTVTGTRTDGNGTYSKGVTIIQAAAQTAYPSWSLTSAYTYEADGSNYPDVLITDEDNVGWKLILPDWIQTDGGMTEGTGTFSLMMTAKSNTGAERTWTARLVSSDGSKTYATCVLTQKAASPSQEPSIRFATDCAVVKSTDTAFSNAFTAAGLKDISVMTKNGSMASLSASVVQNSVEVQFAAYTSSVGYDRDCTVIVTGTRTDGNGTYSKTFSLLQSAPGNETFTWGLLSSLLGDGFTLDPDGGELVVSIIDSVSAGWNVVLPADLTLKSGSASGVGDGSIAFGYPANLTGRARRFELYLCKGDSTVRRATLYQKAK